MTNRPMLSAILFLLASITMLGSIQAQGPECVRYVTTPFLSQSAVPDEPRDRGNGLVEPDKDLPKWVSVLERIDAKRHAVAGRWTKTSQGLQVAAATGARLTLPFTPPAEYDLRMDFTRQSGVHSVGLFFTHGRGQAGFEIDAWGQHLGGIQNISGKSIRDNATRQENLALLNGRKYTMTVEVRAKQVRALLDDRVVAIHQTDGGDLSLPDLWAWPNKQALGIGAWESDTLFHAIEVRSRNGAPIIFSKAPDQTASRPVKRTDSTSGDPAAMAARPEAQLRPAEGKRVLLVIANYDFFYREYAEPKAEMERAGIKVTVAAGKKERCTPHARSGEGADRGIVQPDLAIAEARAADYDAILFSGGWGASAYQYAFNGRYDTAPYNGDRAVKAAVNRLIGDFIAQDKYVCALCNAVSVLAWARVNGASPLKGVRVCAPTREAAAGIYNGRRAQPSCRWHPEANGAILSPAGSIGRPGTAEDDVLVDGKIVTGEDDPSAREMGRRIVELLSR